MSLREKKTNGGDNVQKSLFPFASKGGSLASSIFGCSEEEGKSDYRKVDTMNSIFDDQKSAQFRNASDSLHKAHDISMKKRPLHCDDGEEDSSEGDVDEILEMRERRQKHPTSSEACQLITFDFGHEDSSTLRVCDKNDTSSEIPSSGSESSEEDEGNDSDKEDYFNNLNLSKSEREKLQKEEELKMAVDTVADIYLEMGVAVIKSEHKNKKSKRLLIPPDLMKEMIDAAKEIELEICNKLDEAGNLWRAEKSASSSQGNTASSTNKNQKSPYNWRYQEVACRCPGRLDVRYKMDQAPFNDPRIVNNAFLTPLIEQLFGGSGNMNCEGEMSNYLIYSGLIYSFPGSSDQPWHMDGTTLFPEERVPFDLPPYALNVFVPLNDITPDIGPTEFLPASHLSEQAHEIEDDLMKFSMYISRKKGKKRNKKKENNTNSNEDDEISEEEWLNRHSVIAPKLNVGDALLYDYRICHRGTRNLSREGKARTMLYLLFARPWFKEHLNFGGDCLFPPEKGVEEKKNIDQS